jgi:hypothetical protein
VRQHTTPQQGLLGLVGRSSAHATLLPPVPTAVDGFNVVALKPGTATELLLTDSAGQQQRTFADKEGWFTLFDVSPGSYVLTTYNPMFVYPEVCHRRPAHRQQHTVHEPGVWSCFRQPQLAACTPGKNMQNMTSRNRGAPCRNCLTMLCALWRCAGVC